jgi:hypothetical protein
MDAFGRISVAQQDKRIAPGELGDLRLSVLPAVPKPALVVISAEAEGIAAEDFGVGRQQADS